MNSYTVFVGATIQTALCALEQSADKQLDLSYTAILGSRWNRVYLGRGTTAQCEPV